MKNFITPFIFILVLLISCKEETLCDTAGYAPPEMHLLFPEGSEFEVSSDSIFTFVFSFSAEAGLNTFSMNGEPIHAFTDGQTESKLVFSSYFWESGQVEFILHDLCDQSTSIIVNMTVILPTYPYSSVRNIY